LAGAIRAACSSTDSSMPERVVAAARGFSSESALTSYASLIQELLKSKQAGQAS
jgi:colanic acid biosynthesis glycosyl transferase WcaI